ncbi:MAG: T9SS type A sorting domain-containing protein [Bacteroidota bacterium]
MDKLNTNYLRCWIIAALFCGITTLQAQPISHVNSGNSGQFLAEMDAYFGQIMTVTSTQIDQFLQPFLNVQNFANCTDPSPSVISQDSDQVTFRWSGASGSEYQVAYLNLLTGAHGTTSIDEIEHSFTVEDGLYLFVFQQICGVRRSNAVIIILDKVVALEVAPDIDCTCHHAYEYSGPEAEALELSDYVEVNVSIRNEENVEDIPFEMHMQRTCLSCTSYFVNPYCADHNSVDFVYNVGYVEIDESVENVITFSGEELGIEADLPVGYELAIAICKKNSGTPNSLFPGLQIKPVEPGSSYELNAPQNAGVVRSARLVNQAGQVLKVIELLPEQYPLRQFIDLTNYPAGMYFLQIEGKEGLEVKKLLRF